MNGVGDGVGHGVPRILWIDSMKFTGSSDGEQRCEWEWLVGLKLFGFGGRVRPWCQTVVVDRHLV